MDAKELAARKAVQYVQNGMIIGLGSGSTATFAIQAIGERVQKEGLNVRGVPTSAKSRDLAIQLGIPLAELGAVDQIDMTIDGADEVNDKLDLIKGGGGALLREKLVAAASRELLIICDEGKILPELGKFPLPVAVVPFGWQSIQRRLDSYCSSITLRKSKENPEEPFLTDDHLYILDLHLSSIPHPAILQHELKQIVGVVEVGLFVRMATKVIVGRADGNVTELFAE